MGEAKEKKDTVEKEFLAFPDIASDTINALLYQGEAVTDAANLWTGATETIYQGREKLRSQYEDLCKYELADGRVNVMYLIANQSQTDGKMLLRKAGYTGGVYREQYEGKMQEIFPVIELVLYWGSPRWRGCRDSRQLFPKRKLSDKAWKYIDSFRLHVFEMRHLPGEVRHLFQSDMRIVADYLAEGDSYRSDRKIVHKAALLKMLGALSGEGKAEEAEAWLEGRGIREEDEITVCELFDQYVRQGREEGRYEGDARRLVLDIEKIMKNMHLSLEKACEVFEIPVGKYEEAKNTLGS